MVDLNRLIICPTCHADLPLQTIREEGSACCFKCGRRYTFKHGIFNMTPLPPPDEIPQSRWGTWQQLQDNGLRCYITAPEFNLSTGHREDERAFKTFCQSSGLILDVGCGPQAAYPTYLPERGQVVGIDPLLGQQPREFSFVQGIGEYLPFPDGTFDHVLYASSLDHVMDPERSLAEAVRCLKPGGHLNLWIDGLAADNSAPNPSWLGRHRALIKKGVSSLLRHEWLGTMGLRRFIFYMVSVARMKVPEGAADYFHFVHLNVAAVCDWLSKLDLTIIRQQEYQSSDSVFIQARKQLAGPES